MSESRRLVMVVTLAGALAACTDFLGGGSDPLLLSEAFQTIPVGFSANSQSFSESADAGVPFTPGALEQVVGFHGGGNGRGGEKGGSRGGDHRDGMGPGLRGLLMGGGLGPDFVGAIAFGKGRGRGPFGVFTLPADCAWDEAVERVVCPEIERHGLTVNRSYAFTDTAGDAQPAFDTLSTDAVNVRTAVAGTKTRHDGRVTSTVEHESDRTVSGLAPGSTSRTVTGTARAEENTTGIRDSVPFTATRIAGDTTTGVVIPIVDGRPTMPSSGTIVRSMTVTITPQGGTPTTKSRREVITFDGTNVIRISITQDGETRNCTLTLPGKELSCS